MVVPRIHRQRDAPRYFWPAVEVWNSVSEERKGMRKKNATRGRFDGTCPNNNWVRLGRTKRHSKSHSQGCRMWLVGFAADEAHFTAVITSGCGAVFSPSLPLLAALALRCLSSWVQMLNDTSGTCTASERRRKHGN